MDSGRKRNDRVRTPSHNASLFVSKSSTSKRFPGAKGIHLNDTVCTTAELPKMKTAISATHTLSQTLETECDIAYNDYLQALMKQEIVEREIDKQTKILNGQMVLQYENIEKRNLVYQEIKNEIESFEKKENIIVMMNTIQKNLETIKTIYTAYQMESLIEKFSKLLTSECDKVILKNIKPIKTQEEYDQLFKFLENFQSTLMKIIKSGRDFDGINSLAKDIKISMDHMEQIKESTIVSSNVQNDAVSALLSSLSDIFSKQYIDQ